MKNKAVIITAVLSAFLATFATSALNLSVPDMSTYFNMGATSVNWISTIYIMTVAAVSIPIGKIADSTSRRNVLIIGLIGYTIFAFAAVFAWNAASILVLRALQGFFSSLIFATNTPIAISAYPPEQKGKAIGIAISGIYTGLALGPVMGGFINTHFTFKGIFVFTSILGVIAIILAVTSVPKDRSESKPKFDAAGNILSILMIACLIYGLTGINSVPHAWAFVIAAAAFAVLFVIAENKSAEPMIDLSLFKDRIYTFSNITALLNYTATYALTYVGSIYLQVVRGYPSQTAGLILIAEPIVMALLTPRMGRLSDRIAPFKLVSGGMALCGATLLFFAFAKETTPIPLIMVMLAIAGLGFAMFSSPNTNVILSCVSPSKFSTANSILSTMRTIGQCMGMAIITLVTSAKVGDMALAEADTSNVLGMMHVSFAIFTVCCIVGVFMSLSRDKK